jgi:hypothetical protein
MFVGMDLHKNYLQITVMNEEGRVLRNSKIDNNLKQISGFFNDIDDKYLIFLSENYSRSYQRIRRRSIIVLSLYPLISQRF